MAYDRGQAERAAGLAAAAGHVWRSLGTSLDAFGPQLSESLERHTPAAFGMVDAGTRSVRRPHSGSR
ncbi:hypothetical protein OIE68_17410 [Nocardia vinacea]|uniref:hypothetical protein n=1 Tax=Nocardia vinacea TaxID=96468 RepID=UPI002E0DF6B4|nr:hypothetical protein OIE68_17410 [Nocardia vinacea]